MAILFDKCGHMWEVIGEIELDYHDMKQKASGPTRKTAAMELRLGYAVAKLLKGETVTVNDLVGLNVSERTARADLAAIETLIDVRFDRTRGAIVPATHGSYFEKSKGWNIDAKRDVAVCAVAEFQPGGVSIAASPGSTVAMTYEALLVHGVSCAVVTNSLALAQYAAAGHQPIHFVGGNYLPEIHALIGQDASDGFQKRPCRLGLLGVSGFSPTADGDCILYVHHDPEVLVLRDMLQAVEEKIVIVANIQKLKHGDPWQLTTLRTLASPPKSPNGTRPRPSRQVTVVTNALEDWNQDLQQDRKQDSQQAIETVNKNFETLSTLAKGGIIKLVTARKNSSNERTYGIRNRAR